MKAKEHHKALKRMPVCGCEHTLILVAKGFDRSSTAPPSRVPHRPGRPALLDETRFGQVPPHPVLLRASSPRRACIFCCLTRKRVRTGRRNAGTCRSESSSVLSPSRIRLRMRPRCDASSPRRACWERDRARGLLQAFFRRPPWRSLRGFALRNVGSGQNSWPLV